MLSEKYHYRIDEDVVKDYNKATEINSEYATSLAYYNRALATTTKETKDRSLTTVKVRTIVQ